MIKTKKFTDYRVVKKGDSDYPKKLQMIKDAPEKLYVRGKLPDPNKKTVSIVGARNCTDYGSTLAKSIARILSLNDVQVISGLAMGIDTQGHIGAIEVEKPTFAVMGCGVDICFPSHNSNVYERILDYGGGIMAEVEVGTPPLPYNFPLRNRIISGLSDVVIVVEARDKSGSLITSDFALEQGKTIFACPGRVGDSLSRGTNNLIKQGAYILTSVDDVLEHLGLIVDGLIPKVEKDVSKLDYFEKTIFDTLSNETLHIDQIVEKAKFPVSKCLNTLMSLELNGFVETTTNNYYRRVE
ncbi:MAG: DNA-processing protein DprA [Lachnospiraceae bacterium]|nr:DNA-processing protein DprA [Clostridia bacterium]MBP3200294.1 DNA-processing protein DprA [Lachnospiraceae bacterium]